MTCRKPKRFERGDAVEAVIANGGEWERGRYVRIVTPLMGGGHVVEIDDGQNWIVPARRIRPRKAMLS